LKKPSIVEIKGKKFYIELEWEPQLSDFYKKYKKNLKNFYGLTIKGRGGASLGFGVFDKKPDKKLPSLVEAVINTVPLRIDAILVFDIRSYIQADISSRAGALFWVVVIMDGRIQSMSDDVDSPPAIANNLNAILLGSANKNINFYFQSSVIKHPDFSNFKNYETLPQWEQMALTARENLKPLQSEFLQVIKVLFLVLAILVTLLVGGYFLFPDASEKMIRSVAPWVYYEKDLALAKADYEKKRSAYLEQIEDFSLLPSIEGLKEVDVYALYWLQAYGNFDRYLSREKHGYYLSELFINNESIKATYKAREKVFYNADLIKSEWESDPVVFAKKKVDASYFSLVFSENNREITVNEKILFFGKKIDKNFDFEELKTSVNVYGKTQSFGNINAAREAYYLLRSNTYPGKYDWEIEVIQGVKTPRILSEALKKEIRFPTLEKHRLSFSFAPGTDLLFIQQWLNDMRNGFPLQPVQFASLEYNFSQKLVRWNGIILVRQP
jgi:hypothetical protein